MTRSRIPARMIALAVATAMLLAMVPALATAKPAEAVTHDPTLPANWTVAYRTDASTSAWSVSADGTNVAWLQQALDGGAYSVVLFDSVTKALKSWRLEDESYPFGLSLSGHWAAWSQNGRIYLLDTRNGDISQIAGGETPCMEPCVSGDKVVYSVGEFPWRELYVHDITAGTDTLLVSLDGNAGTPAVYGNRVVFAAFIPELLPTEVSPRANKADLPSFDTGSSVGYVPLSGGTPVQIGEATSGWIGYPAIWGQFAVWLQPTGVGPQPLPQVVDPVRTPAESYNFGSSTRSPYALDPAPVGFLKIRGDVVAWMSGTGTWADSVGDAKTTPDKPTVGTQSSAAAAIAPNGQLNWRNAATGEQHAFMVGAAYDSFGLGTDLFAWSYLQDPNVNGDRGVIVAQYVAPPAPLYLGDPNVPWKVRRNRYFEVFGALSPAHANGGKWVQLSFERWVGKRYRYQFTSTATSYDTGASSQHYGLQTKVSRTGGWRVRAFHPADADGPDLWTGYHSFRVR